MYDFERMLSPKQAAIILDPEELAKLCADYFKWCVENPLQEEQLFHHKGEIVRGDKDKVRPFTKRGLFMHIGIPESRWAAYKDRQGDWAHVVEMVDQIIYTQKFENAAAGLLNATIISRDLGLAERNEHSGPEGGPMQVEETTPLDRIRSRLARLAPDGPAESDSGGAE